MPIEDWPDEIIEIWDESTGYYGNYLTEDERQDFTESGQDAFIQGWFDADATPEEREAAREAFFELMEMYDLDISLFDWDDWRDWYEAA